MTAERQKTPRILVINTPGLYNRGGMAVVMGSLRCLRETLPEADITVLCHHCREDWDTLQQICQRHDVALKRHPWFREHNSRFLELVHSAIPALLFMFECVLGRMARGVGLYKGLFQKYDVILDLNIDALHDHYGIFFPSWALANVLLGEIAGRPVIVWSAGIGIFRRRLTRLAARFVLSRVDAIVTREEVSKQYLETMGISRPKVYVTADHAFMMQPAPQARIDEILAAEGIERGRSPLLGVSASNLISRYAFPGIKNREKKHQCYVEVMARTIDYLVRELGVKAILIPHSIVASEDDRVVSREIFERIESTDEVRLLNRDYMADELKGIIGTCDMLIGCRMHSTIASTSMGVPTIAVVYGQKSLGIIGTMMGQSEYVIEIAKCSPDQLLSELRAKTFEAWAKRVAIRQDLVARSQAVRERALLNGTLVRDLLRSDGWA